MANAKHDGNGVPTMLGLLNTNGVTLTPIYVNASNNNGMKIDDNTTGSDNGPAIPKRDGNRVVGLSALSSADGTTIVPLYVTSDNKLLIKST